MDLAIRLFFFNPIAMGGYNFLAWKFIGLEGLAFALFLPIAFYLFAVTQIDPKAKNKKAQKPNKILSWVASQQVCYLGIIAGGWLFLEGLGGAGSIYTLLGAILLFPAILLLIISLAVVG
jgi:hypothetical protein